MNEFLLFHFSTIAFRLPLVFILDLILGELNFLTHPVVLIGKLISKCEKLFRRIFKCPFPHQNEFSKTKKFRERIAGFMLVLVVCSVSFFLPFAIELFFSILPSIIRQFFPNFPVISIFNSQFSILNFQFSIVIDVFWGYQSIAARCLCDEAMNVSRELSISIEKGRSAVSRIVGRETKFLDKKGVIKACVETVAENTTDGIFSPLIFYILGGAPFAFFYKAINTMDSMIAYKNERYKYFGTFAARLDDFANFIPARICAFFMLIVGLKKRAWKIFFRDRYKHDSPNSAQTESVMAGILGVQLNGDAVYEGKIEKKQIVGDNLREIEIVDIKKSIFIMYASTVLFVIVSTLIFLIKKC